MSGAIKEHNDCDWSRATLHDVLLRVGPYPGRTSRAAAVVTIIAAAAPRWNTSDGHRPTQAEIDGLHNPTMVGGHWPAIPGIFTPYALRVLRTLRGTVPGPTLEAYIDGGSTGRDVIQGCEMPGRPQVGGSFVVIFDAELTTGLAGLDPLREPVIGEVLAYDRQTDVVTMPAGPESLAEQVRTLPPG